MHILDFLVALLVTVIGIAASVGGALMVATSSRHRHAARIAFLIGSAMFWLAGIFGAANVIDSTATTKYILVGIVGAASAMFALWTFNFTGGAMAEDQGEKIAQSASHPTVIQGSPAGTGADINVQGSPGATTPNVGLVAPNGLDIRANGGTGMRVTVGGNGGPAIGVVTGPIKLSR